jgi:hypothetical protein
MPTKSNGTPRLPPISSPRACGCRCQWSPVNSPNTFCRIELEHFALEPREDLGRLADVQAALRRVATLVARGASPSELARALAVQHASVWR